MTTSKLGRGMWMAVAIVALALPLAGQARACEPISYYRKVVEYVCQEVPYQAYVVRYDHCGRPYHVYVTRYRTVHVPVVKWVRVCR